MKILSDALNYITNIKFCNHKTIKYVAAFVSCVFGYLLAKKINRHRGTQNDKSSAKKCEICKRKCKHTSNTITSETSNSSHVHKNISMIFNQPEETVVVDDTSKESAPQISSSIEDETNDYHSNDSSIEVPRITNGDGPEEILQFLTYEDLIEHQIALHLSNQSKESEMSDSKVNMEENNSFSYSNDASLYDKQRPKIPSVVTEKYADLEKLNYPDLYESYDENKLHKKNSTPFDDRSPLLEINADLVSRNLPPSPISDYLSTPSPVTSPVIINKYSPDLTEMSRISKNLSSELTPTRTTFLSQFQSSPSQYREQTIVPTCLPEAESASRIANTIDSNATTTNVSVSQTITYENFFEMWNKENSTKIMSNGQELTARYYITDNEFMEEDKYLGDKGKKPMSGRYAYKKGRSKVSNTPTQSSQSSSDIRISPRIEVDDLIEGERKYRSILEDRLLRGKQSAAASTELAEVANGNYLLCETSKKVTETDEHVSDQKQTGDLTRTSVIHFAQRRLPFPTTPPPPKRVNIERHLQME